MSINTLFPSADLTDNEQKHLKGIFSDPIVIKYLKHLGTEDSKDLLTLNALDMPPEQLARRHVFLDGKLAVITTLLSISIKE